MALALETLVSGHLRGMFDGRSTIDLGSAERGFVVDLHWAWSSEDTLAPVLAAALTAVASAIASAKTPTCLVVDEAWAVLSGGVDYLRAVGKLARSLGVALVLVLHRLSDLGAAGDDASAIAKRAQGLFAEAETVVSFGQAPNDAAVLGQALDLSGREVEILSHLARGEALATVGATRRLVGIELSAAETATATTDSAMLAAIGPPAPDPET